jgi:hypothetical protein
MTLTSTVTPIEDKYTSVKQIIELGREKGYLLYDEIYEMLPEEVVSLPDELDDVYQRFAALGIDVIDRPERYQNRDELETTGTDFEKKDDDAPEFTLPPTRRPTTRCACTCGRWAPCRCWIARVRWKSPSASSRASG